MFGFFSIISPKCDELSRRQKASGQLGSVDSGALLARDDLLGLMSRMMKRPTTRRINSRINFRFVYLRW